MKRLSIRTAVVAGFAAILSMPVLFAQNTGALKVNVPFDFVARGKACPAGVYIFTSEDRRSVSMKNTKGTVYVEMPVITDIARSGNEDDHLLAFDRVNDKRVLSEVWLHERDGALVNTIKGEHTRDTIRLRAANRGGDATGSADRSAR